MRNGAARLLREWEAEGEMFEDIFQRYGTKNLSQMRSDSEQLQVEYRHAAVCASRSNQGRVRLIRVEAKLDGHAAIVVYTDGKRGPYKRLPIWTFAERFRVERGTK